MVDNTDKQETIPTSPCSGPCPTPAATCSKATMCKEMLKNLPSGYLLMVPGAVLVLKGVLGFFEPTILLWLGATAIVLVGIMLLLMGGFIRGQRAA